MVLRSQALYWLSEASGSGRLMFPMLSQSTLRL